MGSRIQLLGLCLWFHFACFIFIFGSRVAVGGDATVKGTVAIDDKAVIGTTDADFVCATLDWWPPQKCDYGKCSWGLASLLNLVFLLSFLLFQIADEFLKVVLEL